MQNPDVQNVMRSLGIIGNSPLLLKAINAAIQVAPYDVTVLVTGENGVGKDSFYKILHNYSYRRHKKCIPVNCGGLPEGTIDSELFGHVKGAYTGSVGDRKGYFEEADGGTIFLDEVGDLPMAIQAKLLRVLEKGEIMRMGSNEVKKVDVRVVAATNVDLQKAIREGKFREDLYYRLSTVSIQVPALRDRPEDIFLLFRYFANETARKYQMTAGIQLDENAKQLLLAYQWPGNVRQLLHLVEEISIIEMNRTITAETLRRYLPKFVSGVSVGGSADGDTFSAGEKEMLYRVISKMRQELNEVREHLGMSTPAASHPIHMLTPGDSAPIVTPYNKEVGKSKEENFDEYEEAVEVEEADTAKPMTNTASASAEGEPVTMADFEKLAVSNALRRCGGNKQKAATLLGISYRTIQRKIEDYGLE